MFSPSTKLFKTARQMFLKGGPVKLGNTDHFIPKFLINIDSMGPFQERKVSTDEKVALRIHGSKRMLNSANHDHCEKNQIVKFVNVVSGYIS